jgi:hypothetical protein
MKKKIKLFFLFFLMINYRVFTFDCPDGYTMHTLVKVFDCQPALCERCTVAIPFCCKWNTETHQLDIIFEDEWAYFLRWSLCCYYLLLDTAVFENFLDSVLISSAEDICHGQYPPCDHPTRKYYEVVIAKPICVYYKNTFEPPLPGEEPMWLLKVRRCANNAYCYKKYRVCKDYAQNPPQIVKTLVEVYVSSHCEETECPTSLPPTGKSWEEEWETGCCYRGCQ